MLLKRIPILSFSVALLFAGCSLVDSGRPQLSLSTDREAYAFESAEKVIVEVENISSSVIYFNSCMPARIEELEGNRIGAVLWFPVCGCNCVTELKPDEKWSYSAPVGWVIQNRDRFALREGNTYRVNLVFYEDKGMREPLKAGVTYTNEFKLIE